jgi:hypothetical protein
MDEEEPEEYDHCEFCDKMGWRTIDPYTQDLYNTTVYVYLCWDCYEDRMADI